MHWLNMPQKWGVKLLVFVLRIYRNYISRLMLPRCRFYPSCSAYALDALQKKGLWLGLWLSLRRLCRCHPFSHRPFYDPLEIIEQ